MPDARSGVDLMWSHYADHDQGICLEFGLGNDLFRWAYEVDYRQDYPEWTPEDMINDRAMEAFLTKSDDWRYEHKFRLISSSEFMPNTSLSLIGDYFSLPAGALQSVIVGCNGSFDTVKEIVDQYAPGLRIQRAVRAPNHYRLQILNQGPAFLRQLNNSLHSLFHQNWITPTIEAGNYHGSIHNAEPKSEWEVSHRRHANIVNSFRVAPRLIPDPVHSFQNPVDELSAQPLGLPFVILGGSLNVGPRGLE